MPRAPAPPSPDVSTLALPAGGALALPAGPSRPSNANAAAVYLASVAEGSRPAHTSALRACAVELTAILANAMRASGATIEVNPNKPDPTLFPWYALRYEHTAALQGKLLERLSPVTVRRMMSAVRGVLRTAYRLNQISKDDYEKAIDTDKIVGESPLSGRYVEPNEIDQVYAAASKRRTAVRDLAILALFTDCGLRRVGILRLQLADYEREARMLTVTEKRMKRRRVPLTENAASCLDAWIAQRGSEPGSMFSLSRNGISKAMEALAKIAGVQDISPHDFRRTYISDALDSNIDLAAISSVVGHSDPATTLRYDRRGDRARVKIAAAVRKRNY